MRRTTSRPGMRLAAFLEGNTVQAISATSPREIPPAAALVVDGVELCNGLPRVLADGGNRRPNVRVQPDGDRDIGTHRAARR